MKTLVSIILPYRNAAPFLAQAIASVERQRIPFWKLLLIDDHSTDEGRGIAEQAAANDKRILNLRSPAGEAGAAAARNLGLRHATGDYVAFLDADDLLFPDKLETEISLMERFPEIGMTWGATRWWYPGQEYRNWSDCPRRLAGRVHKPPSLLNSALLLQDTHVPSLCGIMVRRAAIPEEPAFEPGLELYEDQSFIAKVLAHWPVYVGRHRTALYRQHAGSASAQAETEGAYGRIGPHPARSRFLAWVRAYIDRTPDLQRQSGGALRIAGAIQSGDPSTLSVAEQRALVRRQLVKSATRPFAWAGGSLKRRLLQVIHWRNGASDPLGRPL
ncbi:glycosyltransferase family 2 protein [Sphingomonas sp. URHD0057]|uniref:glycosyltransferase family 2 protein n=1 Tax=Sphingomonas sp. URHD0057 TaxID=1380389 RepID=UPI000685964A|nr:glycosyltransferase family 2 protein [Sphingomonas sp. URHD0057]